MYIIEQVGYGILGIGVTEAAAWADASFWAQAPVRPVGDGRCDGDVRAVPSTPALNRSVAERGWCGQRYELVGGVATLVAT